MQRSTSDDNEPPGCLEPHATDRGLGTVPDVQGANQIQRICRQAGLLYILGQDLTLTESDRCIIIIGIETLHQHQPRIALGMPAGIAYATPITLELRCPCSTWLATPARSTCSSDCCPQGSPVKAHTRAQVARYALGKMSTACRRFRHRLPYTVCVQVNFLIDQTMIRATAHSAGRRIWRVCRGGWVGKARVPYKSK